MRYLVPATAAAGLLLSMTFAQAQAVDIGRYEFETYCAACHGVDGKGGGPMSMLLTKQVPNLTVLSKNNGGSFPFERAYGVISGEVTTPAHGTREMPIWGDHYKDKAPSQLGPYYQSSDVSSYVRGRILALIGYLSTLQIK
jgi:mono/diheme cytochrome c family protein